MKAIFALCLFSLSLVFSQPPPPGGNGGAGGGTITVSGQASSTACTVTSGTCANDGSSNYITRSLAYDGSTGKFTGTLTTNGCPNGAKYNTYTGYTGFYGGASAVCVQQTLPAPSYTTGPSAAPLRGVVGYSMYGVNIYGPLEAGFTAGQACTNGLGTCSGGLDLATCEAKLTKDCGAANVKSTMLLDVCGGHANPYHIHTDMLCDYNTTAAGHSKLIGVALDGRGIYGKYESTGTLPTDLDACNGHYGPVPSTTVGSDSYPANTNSVYHYHTSESAPFTLGCFGPTTSLTQCKSLYTTCSTGYEMQTTSKGCVNYDLDCPCYRQANVTYNQMGSVTCTNAAMPAASLATFGVVSLVTITGLFVRLF